MGVGHLTFPRRVRLSTAERRKLNSNPDSDPNRQKAVFEGSTADLGLSFAEMSGGC
jgi:hypothetical protein